MMFQVNKERADIYRTGTGRADKRIGTTQRRRLAVRGRTRFCSLRVCLCEQS